jgi:transcription antitermination factor NusG
LFPGYLFARLELEHHQPTLERIPNILRLVGYGERHPAVIEDSQIEAIRILAASPCSVQPEPFQVFHEQDSVLVIAGPLAGLSGTVAYAPEGKARLVISVPMLHRAVSAEVEADWLQRAKS